MFVANDFKKRVFGDSEAFRALLALLSNSFGSIARNSLRLFLRFAMCLANNTV